ncbi:MAG: hypothetical protein GEU73_12290 [Chloroflexi bacterium]|nr:hypothetical protein [Chloroflexota bacterium]
MSQTRATSRTLSTGLTLILAALLALASTSLLARPAHAQATSYQGEAWDLNAHLELLGSPTDVGPFADAGPLPSAGGEDEETAVDVDALLGILSASVLHAETSGENDLTESGAHVTNLEVNLSTLDLGVLETALLDLGISASVIESIAGARCLNGKPDLDGDSLIVGLAINGQPIEITGQPNQGVDLGLIKLVINEQIETENSIEVNALHIMVSTQGLTSGTVGSLLGILGLQDAGDLVDGLTEDLLLLDITVAHSEAGITCEPDATPTTQPTPKPTTTPQPTATRTPEPTVKPPATSSPLPTATPEPMATPSYNPQPPSEPTPMALPSAGGPPPTQDGGSPWQLGLVGAIAVAGAAGARFFITRRLNQ